MEDSENSAVAAFDAFYTTDHIRILKTLLPFTQEPVRRILTVLIRVLELRYTMEALRQTPAAAPGEDSGPGIRYCGTKCGEPVGAAGGRTLENWTAESRTDLGELFDRIRCFCTPAERSILKQLVSLKKNLEMYERITEMMRLFSQSGQAENAGEGSSSDGFDAADLFQGMLTPEQQAILEMFQTENAP